MRRFSSFSNCARFSAWLVLLLLAGQLTSQAQTAAHFDPGVIAPGGGFSYPTGVAVDGSGNVYVADMNNSAVKEVPVGCSSSSCVVTLGGGFSYPYGVAVDGNGNVYVADYYNSAVKKIPPGCASSACVVTLGGGFSYPMDVAVDGSGNVYVGDGSGTGNVKRMPAGCASSSCVTTLATGLGVAALAVDGNGNVFFAGNGVKEILAAGGYTTIVTLGSGFASPSGVDVDGSGNVFVGDADNNAVKEILAAGGYGTVNTLGNGFSAPHGVAVDANGNVYVADYLNNSVKEILAAQRFPTTAVGSTSSTISFSFTFDAKGMIDAPQVLTQGAAGLDFVDAGTGTCTTNGPTYRYDAGATCTVDVQFAPSHPGTRYGAVVLTSGGSPIATLYIGGTGTGPQIIFPSSNTPSVLGSGFIYPFGAAVDGNGNVFVADYNDNAVKEILATGGYTTVTTVGGGFNAPTRVAVDGAGNVFVADSGNLAVKKVPVGCVSSSCVIELGGGFKWPSGVAVDGSGNVFVADSSSNAVSQMPAGCTSSSCVTTLSSGFNYPYGVAVDGSGNVFVADTSNDAVKEIPAGCTSPSCVVTLGTGFNAPYGVAVDGSGNVFVADTGNTAVKEIVAAGGYSTVNTLGGFTGPYGVAVDGSGNVFVADSDDPSVKMLDLSDPLMLTFATADVGSTSADSPQTLTISNNGNADLTFPIPSTGTNPSVSTNFTLDAGSTCPEIDSSSGTPGTLAAGASCTYLINFAPTAAGSIYGSLVLTDNSLNANPDATQTFKLSGTGAAATTSTTLSISPNPATVGQTVTFTANVSATSGTPTGTVSFYDGSTLLGTANADGSGNATFSTSVLTAGAYSITAVYPGDSAYAASSSTVVSLTLSVPLPSTTTTLSISPNTATIGQAVTFTAMVSAGSGTPTGTVNFYDGATLLGTGTVDGSGNATFSTSSLAAGTYSVTAVYSGDSAYGTSTSAAVSLTVKLVIAFPGVPYGTTTPENLTLPFPVPSGDTIDSVSVLTMGALNLDFTKNASSTCAIGTTTDCAVTVDFLPTAPGLRRGAVVIVYHDAGSNSYTMTVPVYGVADAPQVTINPGTASVLATGANSLVLPNQIALDGSGNVYVTDVANQNVMKIPAGGGSSTILNISIPKFSLQSPVGITMDGAGNLYIGDSSRHCIVWVNTAGDAGVLPISAVDESSLFPAALAMDAEGNLYIADAQSNRVLKVVITRPGSEAAAGAGSVVSLGGYSFAGTYAVTGVAVDLAGNIYATDGAGGAVLKVAPSGSVSTLTFPNWLTVMNPNPRGVSVDGFGNVYFTDPGNGKVFEQTTAGVTIEIPTPGLSPVLTAPANVTIDPAGRLYIADLKTGRVVLVDPTAPNPYGFASTAVGSTSSDSPQTYTATNIGNQDLNISGVSYPTDFPENASDTNLCPGGTTLTAGMACDVSIKFVPTTAGSLTGSVVLTDNNLLPPPPPCHGICLASYSQQTIAVSGTGLATLAQFAISTAWTAIAGTPQTITIQAEDRNGGALSSYTGAIDLTSSDTLAVFSLTPGGAPITSYTFTNADGGTKTIYVTFYKSGQQTVTVADSAAGVTNNSNTVTVNAAAAAKIAAQGATSGSATIGGRLPDTTVIVTDAYNNPVSGVTVTYAVPASGASALLGLPTQVTAANGWAWTSAIANTIAGGPYTVTATLTGLTGSPVNFTFTNLPDSTTTSISAAPASPSVYGNAITLTATVAPASYAGMYINIGPPTGTVKFYDTVNAATRLLGSATLGGGPGSSPNVNRSGVRPNVRSGQAVTATATFSITAAAVGQHAYSAVYETDGNFTASTSADLPYTVTEPSATSTTTTLSISPSPATAGQAVTFTATVSPAPTGSSLGTVSFYNGSTLLGTGTVNASGVATFTTSSLAAGAYSVTAVYSGNSGYDTSTSPAASLAVNAALTSTTTTLLISPSPATAGQAVTFTATVSPASTGSSLGTVSFYNGSTLLGTGTVNASGVATFTTSSLAAGAYSVTAVYSGNSGYDTSTSQPVSLTVNANSSAAASTTTLSTSPSTAMAGTTVTLTATISPAPGITPGGTVSFYDGTTLLGTATVDSSGVATFTTADLAMGTYSLTAAYSGCSTVAASTSSVVSLTIGSGYKVTAPQTPTTIPWGGSGNINVNVPPIGGAFNQPVTLSATGLPTGATATFDPLAVTPGANGASTVMTIHLSTLAAGLSSRHGRFPLAPFGVAFGALGMLVLPSKRLSKKAAVRTVVEALLLVTMMAAVGCGGGFNAGPNAQPGTYVVTITGTSGTLHASTNVTIVIK